MWDGGMDKSEFVSTTGKFMRAGLIPALFLPVRSPFGPVGRSIPADRPEFDVRESRIARFVAGSVALAIGQNMVEHNAPPVQLFAARRDCADIAKRVLRPVPRRMEVAGFVR